MTGVPLWINAVAACVIGLLSGMGMGSAGLFVLYLTSIGGMAQAEAQGLNLIFYLCSAGASLLLHAQKQKVSPRMIRFLVAFAVLGVFPGTYLAGVLDASLLRRLFGGMLVATGAQTLFKSRGLRTKTTRKI